MGKVAIVTDSTACIPKELVERYNIGLVPVYLVFGDRVFQDGVDLMPEEFYGMLREAKDLPTTSSPSIGDYLTMYQKKREGAEAIVCFTIAKDLAVMHNCAMAATKMMEGTPIYVVDTRTATMAQGFVVLAAARAAAAGASPDQVIAAAEEIIPLVEGVFVLDTLKYLVRGGRVPRAAGWATALLNIKPILRLKDGRVGLLARARGSQQALRRIVQAVREQVAPGARLHAAVHHADVPEEAKKLRVAIAADFDCAELYITEFTPVMGAHTGPGVLGVAFYSEGSPPT